MTVMMQFVCEETLGRREKTLQKIFDKCELMDMGYETPCLCWMGPTSGNTGRGKDYPRMQYEGQTVAVHRVVYTNVYGYLGSKKTLDHLCKVRNCVRPDHLEKVTHKENCRRRDESNGVKRKPRRRRKAKRG